MNPITVVENFVLTCARHTHPVFLPTPPEATDQGVGASGRRELKSVPFISYLSALQKSQLLSDDVVNGMEIRCEEKGSCPTGCQLCHHQDTMGGVLGRGHGGNSRSGEQPSPAPVLLEVSRVVPLYSLVQDNITKEVRKQRGGMTMSYTNGPKLKNNQKAQEEEEERSSVC